MTVRVLLADDQTLVRAGFRVLLERAPDIEVVAEANDGEEAIALTRAHRPDVVLMDIRMPGTDGLTAARRILADARLPDVRVVVLTTFEPGRVRLRGAAGRRERVPAQGSGAGRTAPGGTCGRRR